MSANDKLRQARADFIASDTSTGITEPSRGAMGPDPERVVAERSPGINTLCRDRRLETFWQRSDGADG